MEKLNKGLLLDKVDELVSLIKNSSDYKRFTEIRDKMKIDNEIMSCIKEIKDLQKEIVNLEYRGLDIMNREDQISERLKQLESYPIYTEYSYLLNDFNEMFQGIKNILETYINDKLN